MVGDGGANLDGGLAEFELRVGEEGLLGAGGALGAVQALVATAQAGVAESAVAAAVARELVEDVSDLDGLLIDVDLPGIAEVLAGELGAREDGGQGADLEGRGGVIGGNVVGGVGPLRVACRGDAKDNQTQDPTAVEELLHGEPSLDPF